jgi:hypothetical protein
MDFESLVGRLTGNPKVDGLLFLGSTGQSTLNAYGDRDLLIVLSERGVLERVWVVLVEGCKELGDVLPRMSIGWFNRRGAQAGVSDQ